MIYSTVPFFGYPSILSRKLIEIGSSGKPLAFEMRGGILFKILLILFKCAEILKNPDILEFLVELFTTQLQRLPTLKEIKGTRQQTEKAIKDIFRADIEFAHAN